MELHFKELLNDIYKVSYPRTTEEFFRTLRIKPLNEMLTYLLILGIFTFIGYLLRHSFFLPPKYPIVAVKISLLYYLIGIYIPTGIISILIMAYIFPFVSEKLVSRKVNKEEAFAILGYAAVPQLIGGFFGILEQTWVIHLLLMIYSIIILYIGIKVRFGFKFSIQCFIFLLASGSIVSMVLFRLGGIILGIPAQYYGL